MCFDTKHCWKAENYHKNSSIQEKAALSLLEKISIPKIASILDVGCGDGKITAFLAKKLLQSQVLGIDQSAEMIAFAQKKFQLPNLKFVLKNAIDIQCIHKFNLIFSSFAIQWIRNKELFFKKIFNALEIDGLGVFTIPLGIPYALENSIQKIISSPKWSFYFTSFSPSWDFFSEEKYRAILALYKFDVLLFNKIEQREYFISRHDLEQYILPWFSYLKVIPVDLRSSFFDEIISDFLEETILINDKICFVFPRLDMIIKKVIF